MQQTLDPAIVATGVDQQAGSMLVVNLFHYSDLWQDLGGQVSRLADILDVPLDADGLGEP